MVKNKNVCFFNKNSVPNVTLLACPAVTFPKTYQDLKLNHNYKIEQLWWFYCKYFRDILLAIGLTNWLFCYLLLFFEVCPPKKLSTSWLLWIWRICRQVVNTNVAHLHSTLSFSFVVLAAVIKLSRERHLLVCVLPSSKTGAAGAILTVTLLSFMKVNNTKIIR